MANFFKSDSERQLWIKLNAERIQYSQKVVNGIDEDLGTFDNPWSHMSISKNQLKFDEATKDVPRFSLEELLTQSQQDLLRLSRSRNAATVYELFESFKIKNPLDDNCREFL
jgi:hypothetical protein